MLAIESKSSNDTSKEDYIPVKVALRVRPLSDKEKLERAKQCIRFVDEEPQVIIGNKCFTYDYVFTPDHSQIVVFDRTANPLVTSLFKGLNVTVLAYGQTGSGKTYTMGSGNNCGVPSENLGLIPRVIDMIFDKVHNNPSIEVTASFLELYNEEIRDMLAVDGVRDRTLQIREDPSRGVYVANLANEVVKTKLQLQDALLRGYTWFIDSLMTRSLNRTTGSTLMNNESSRSHAVFTITIHQNQSKSNDQTIGNVTTSKFNFVDLAGSERLKRTGAEGQRLKEGININAGLLALGNVISALSEKKKHIPYRDSKLTRLLVDSLGGNSNTLMIACCSPSIVYLRASLTVLGDTNFEETLNTLMYADRARKIVNKPIVNLDPTAQLIADLRKQVAMLQAQLGQTGSQNNDCRTPATKDGPSSAVLEQLQERVFQLDYENAVLKKALLAAKDTEKELRTNVIQFQTQSEILQLELSKYQSTTGSSLDSGVQKLVEGYLITIDGLKAQLAQVEQELQSKLHKQNKDSATASANPRKRRRRIPSGKQSGNDNEVPSTPAPIDLSPKTPSERPSFHYGEYNQDTAMTPARSDYESDEDSRESALMGSDEDELTVESEDDEDHVSEIASKAQSFDNAHAHMNLQLTELEKGIRLKEDLIMHLSESSLQVGIIQKQYFERMKAMEDELSTLKQERDKYMKELEFQTEHVQEKTVHVIKQYEDKMASLKEQLVAIKLQQKEHDKLAKLQAQSEQKIQALQTEIVSMKKQKVDLIKKMKEESKMHAEWKKNHDKELMKLKKAAVENQRTISMLSQKTRQQDAILQKRLAEVQSSQKKVKELSATISSITSSAKKSYFSSTSSWQQRRRATSSPPYKVAPQKNHNLMALSKSLKDWVHLQISNYIKKLEAEENLEKELKVREDLVAEVGQLRSRQSEIESLPREGGRPAEFQEISLRIDALEENIDYQSNKISQVQAKIVNYSNSNTPNSSAEEDASQITNEIVAKMDQLTHKEAKAMAKYLLETILQCKDNDRSGVRKMKQMSQELSDATQKLREMESMNLEYNNRIVALQMEFEQTNLLLLKQINSEDCCKPSLDPSQPLTSSGNHKTTE